MSTDKPTPPDGFEQFESADLDGEVPTVELGPGDVLEGLVLDFTEGEGEYGPWYRLKIKDESRGVVRYFAKGEVKRAAAQDRIEVGDPIWVAMDTEETTLERDDGSTHDYHPTMVAFPGGS
ncbi:hypothetical protein GRS48_05515 [Halorubrum sp. JWXQ-INN 858]|uniref:hypothetical protein n=1 Tax=Halorubrum sp. JWXQ-INN 858 TaxID=2690782 RepID=UPI001359A43B|nr:hypothetical protein [Halorubrum sp. JWXQ-INN 858]MWV64283.1 hypothetical protein [Halorubrum sp. JWXQ-INN 858]